MLSNNDVLSRTITFLRLPLMVAVVFIHTNLADVTIGGKQLVVDGQFPIHDILRHIISEEIARIAVPLFFFISGFLFFIHTDFSLSAYKDKLKKRVRTLLIPYLFWNIAILILFFLTQTFLASMTSGNQKLISNYTLSDWFLIFWDYKGGMPICYQFWFIRNLMVVMLCSPIVYWIVRYGKLIGVSLLGLLWCFGIWFNVVGFSSAAFFFFTFGAWFAINGRNFITDFKPLRMSFSILYLVIVTADTILWRYGITGCHFVHNLGIVVGLVTILTWTAYGLENNTLRCNAFLAGSSFFIYAYHGMPVAFVVKYWVKLMQPPTELTMIAGYLLIPILIVALGIGIYALLKKYLPGFTAVITGGR